MAKYKKQELLFSTDWIEGQTCIIKDTAHKSKAFVPIRVDTGNSIQVVKVDGGLITGLSEGEVICDNLVYTLKDNSTGLNITWIIELKGTQNAKEAKHAIEQIIKSIQYMQDQISFPQATKYITNRDFVFAAVAGAPDKTLPILNNEDIKSLCKKLKVLSRRRKDVKDMFTLFCYIKPNERCKRAELRGHSAPYDIVCYNKQDGYIAYPSLLIKMLGQNIDMH